MGTNHEDPRRKRFSALGTLFLPSPCRGSNATAPTIVVAVAAPPTTAALTAASPVAAAPLVVLPTAAVASPSAAQGNAAVDSSAATPAPRRYHTRVGPTPPSLPHPRPSRTAPSSKRAQTSCPGESSSSRPQEPQSPPHQGPAGAPSLNLSPASIIRRPLFHYNPILGNADYSERDLHDKVYYGAVHNTSSVFQPLGGHRVLPHDDIQAGAQPNYSSFLNRRPAWDSQGLRHRRYIQFASGPHQLGRL